MATLSFTVIQPPVITGLTVTGGINSASLKWNPSSVLTDKYEVWYSTTDNDPKTASLMATIESNHYSPTSLSTNNTYYFWVRIINQYGVTGPFQTALTGESFKKLKLLVYEYSTASVTTSVQTVLYKIWYDGTSIGSPSAFTSAVVNGTYNGTNWTNPDNARVDDSSYAVVTTTDSNNLVFSLSDFSAIPDTATITGIEFTLKGKTNDVTNSRLYGFIDTPGNSDSNYQFPAFTTNNVDQTVVIGGSTEVFGMTGIGGGVSFVADKITSANTTVGSVTSGSTSIGSSSSLTTITNYNQWYSPGYIYFTAVNNEIVTSSRYVITTISSVSSSGSNQLNVWVRQRLYDDTLSADVPAGTNMYLIFSTFGTTQYGQTSNITNLDLMMTSGFRGLIIPGHTYHLYTEVMKEQASGTPTCTVSVNSSSQSISGSALLS
jgi:hypothetical protein